MDTSNHAGKDAASVLDVPNLNLLGRKLTACEKQQVRNINPGTEGLNRLAKAFSEGGVTAARALLRSWGIR